MYGHIQLKRKPTKSMSLVRVSRSFSLFAGRAIIGGINKNRNVAPLFRVFSSAQFKDIDYVVSPNPVIEEEDTENVLMPVMLDYEKRDMFMKYMSNQEEWSFNKLSEHYGSSLIRTKAIILLMQRRHAMNYEDEKELLRLLGEEIDNESEPLKYRIEPTLSIPPVLADLFKKHNEDKTIPLDVLIKTHNEGRDEVAGVKPLIINESDLKAAFDIIERHNFLQNNYMASEIKQSVDIASALEDGIDFTQFRESPSQYTTSKAMNYHNKQDHHFRTSFTANYHPNLQTDDGVRREMLVLMQRLETETKAQLIHDSAFYERMYGEKSPAERNEEARSTPLPPALQYHQPPPQDAKLSRFKIAFQDLSTSRIAASKKSQRVPDRTIIRTRKGELRYANPLEESKMSWRVHLDGLEYGLTTELPHNYARLMQPYLDPDGDEQAAKDLVLIRKESRKAAFAAAGITK